MSWRRSGEKIPAAERPADPLPPVFAEAGEAILRRPEHWSAEALGFEEVETRLYELLEAIRSGVPPEAPPSAGERVLRQRLLDLLRTSVLERHEAGSDTSADAALLAALQRLESVRRSLDPAWHQLMPALLAGSDGPGLIVEVAHDLRSPLTSIMFLAETLRKGRSGPVTDAQRKQAGIIYSAALGLSTIVSDIIALMRNGDPDRQNDVPFSVAEVFDSVFDTVRPLAEEKELELRSVVLEEDARIGNDMALGRVLLNLVTNALKFTSAGYVEISAVPCGGTWIEFSVRDTGPGMEETSEAAMYRPFRRTAARQGLRFSGTGLGLSICRRTIESLGGELRYETLAEGGTRFHFRLDLPKVKRF